MDKPDRPICNIMQAATLTGVSRRTIYNWMNAGKVEFILLAGGRRRIYRDTLFLVAPVKKTQEVIRG